jgi:hypothetical protein
MARGWVVCKHCQSPTNDWPWSDHDWYCCFSTVASIDCKWRRKDIGYLSPDLNHQIKQVICFAELFLRPAQCLLLNMFKDKIWGRIILDQGLWIALLHLKKKVPSEPQTNTKSRKGLGLYSTAHSKWKRRYRSKRWYPTTRFTRRDNPEYKEFKDKVTPTLKHHAMKSDRGM